MSVQPENQERIRLRLIHEMKEGIYADCQKLPREIVLAEDLGISRNHLRDILAVLEREGFITRRHGVGTIINHHVLHVKNRMDIEHEFLEIISNSGYTPGISSVSQREEPADSYVAEKLSLPEGTPVLRISRVCTADGEPAIYCEDVLAKHLLKDEENVAFTDEDLRAPIFSFLKNFCVGEAYMDLTQLHAVSADGELAELLHVEEGTPLLNMEEVDYDAEGRVIFYSSQYFRDEFFEQTVLRKKL